MLKNTELTITLCSTLNLFFLYNKKSEKKNTNMMAYLNFFIYSNIEFLMFHSQMFNIFVRFIFKTKKYIHFDVHVILLFY